MCIYIYIVYVHLQFNETWHLCQRVDLDWIASPWFQTLLLVDKSYGKLLRWAVCPLLTLYLDKKSRTVHNMKTFALDFFSQINWEDALWKHRTLRGSQSYLYLTLALLSNKRLKWIMIYIFDNKSKYIYIDILENLFKYSRKKIYYKNHVFQQKNIKNLFLSQFLMIRLSKLANYWLTWWIKK